MAGTLNALHAAGRASNHAYEIIVADDASTDRTAEIALQNNAELVSVAHRQIAATRNAGAKAARGDWFIFVDAYTLVNESVVLAAMHAMRHGAVGGGSGMRFDEPSPIYARFLLRLVVRLFRATGLAAGCFLFCTRNAFDAVGGFDEDYFDFEPDFAVLQFDNFSGFKDFLESQKMKFGLPLASPNIILGKPKFLLR